MPKRFTTEEKYKKPWYRQLPPRLKCFWDWCYCNCDIAGIIEIDFGLASFQIGEEITAKDMHYFTGNILPLSNGKYWLTDFILFQGYNKITKLYDKINKILEFNKIEYSIDRVSGVIDTLKDKEKDKEEEKDKEKDKDKDVFTELDFNVKLDFNVIWDNYLKKVGKKTAYRHFKATVKTKQDFEDIQKALENYKKSARVLRGFVQDGSTWFNNWQDWIDFEEAERKDIERYKAFGRQEVSNQELIDQMNRVKLT